MILRGFPGFVGMRSVQLSNIERWLRLRKEDVCGIVPSYPSLTFTGLLVYRNFLHRLCLRAQLRLKDVELKQMKVSEFVETKDSKECSQKNRSEATSFDS